MKKYILATFMAVLCHTSYAHNTEQKKTAHANLYDQKGKIVGKAVFIQHKDGVGVTVNVSGLSAGFHGFHIHTVGQCLLDQTPPFSSAGGHFSLTPTNNHRDHNGDLPVLLANTKGKATAEFETDRFKVTDLFDADGSAVIIHANPDNYANIPDRYTPAADATTLATGDAGARQICGAIKSGTGKSFVTAKSMLQADVSDRRPPPPPPPAQPPATPTNLVGIKAARLWSPQARLNWDKVNNATYYEVWRCIEETDARGINVCDYGNQRYAKVTSNFYAGAVPLLSKVHFKVKAANTAGTSNFSNEIVL